MADQDLRVARWVAQALALVEGVTLTPEHSEVARAQVLRSRARGCDTTQAVVAAAMAVEIAAGTASARACYPARFR